MISKYRKLTLGLILTSIVSLPSFSFQFPPKNLVEYKCLTCKDLSHDVINANWPLQDKPIYDAALPEEKSLKYRESIPLKQLFNQGFSIHTEGPAAIIRLVFPLDKPLLHQLAADFLIETAPGKQLKLSEAADIFSLQDPLKSTFTQEDALTFQLKEQVNTGKFVLKLSSPAAHRLKKLGLIAEAKLTAHIYDKQSSSFLTVKTSQSRYYYDDTFSVDVSLQDEYQNHPIENLVAEIIDTHEKSIPLSFTKQEDNRYTASHPLRIDISENPGENAEMFVTAVSTVNDQVIKRDHRISWSYAIPSARIINVSSAKRFRFNADLEVSTGSRYALEAILYGTDLEGKKHPMQMVQSAAWLSPGKQRMIFSFNEKTFQNFKAPFYLGNFRLIDYNQLKPVYEYPEIISFANLQASN